MRLRPGDQLFGLDSGGTFAPPAPVALQGDRLLVLDMTQPRRAAPPRPPVAMPRPAPPVALESLRALDALFAPVPGPGPSTGAVGPGGADLPGWAWLGLGVLVGVGALALLTGAVGPLAPKAPRKGATSSRRGRRA